MNIDDRIDEVIAKAAAREAARAKGATPTASMPKGDASLLQAIAALRSDIRSLHATMIEVLEARKSTGFDVVRGEDGKISGAVFH